jgi:DNA repair protein RecO (recombination protein O)
MHAKRTARELCGVVLHARAFADAHRIVEVMTAEEGRVCLLARGARASRRRFAGALDLFVSLRMQVSAGRGLWSLAGADVLTQRLGLRTDLDRIRRASHLCDCVRCLVPEHAPAPEIYAALTASLDRLDRAELGAAACYGILLRASGIMPQLALCPRCGERGASLTVEVDPSGSGLLCTRCAPRRPRLPDAAVWVLGGAKASEGSGGHGANDLEQSAVVVEQIALACVEAHTGRALRSRALGRMKARVPSGRKGWR